MTEDTKEQLSSKDLLVAYFDLDYKLNPKGSNYWRNRWGGGAAPVFFAFSWIFVFQMLLNWFQGDKSGQKLPG